MKVYLAARYSRREELCNVRDALRRIGFEVTSRWLNGGHQIDDNGVPLTEERERQFEDGDPSVNSLRIHFAQVDVADVEAAHLIIAFTEEPRVSASRGGRHVELGLAIALHKQIMIVGPMENVFCWLPVVQQFNSTTEMMNEMGRLATVPF